MNKELILKAVQAVMEFNEYQDGYHSYNAHIQVSKYSVWVSVMDFKCLNKAETIFNNHDAKDEDLENFINKLKELECGE